MKQVLLGLFIGLILGVGVGSTLFSPDPVAQQPVLAVPTEAPRTMEPATPGELPTTGSASNRGQAPRLELRAAPVVSTEEIDEAIAATRADDREHERGAGVIQGKALDPEGRGVAGVLVRAIRRNDRSGSASDPSKIGVMPQIPSLEKRLHSAAKEFATDRSRTYEATSNASGAFALRGLVEGRYTLYPYAENYLLGKKGERPGTFAARTGDEIELLAKPIVEVPVSVLFAGGSEVERAIVRCSDRPLTSNEDWSQNLFGYGRNEFEWSPGAPRLRLPAGTVHLKAFANTDPSERGTDKADLRSESVEVELVAGATAAPVILSLEGRSGIRGRVLYPPERLEGVSPRVHLMAIPIGGELNLEALSDADPEVSLWRGADEYSFLDLEPGRYAVGVNRDWGAPIDVHQVVDVGVGITRCDLQLPPLDLDKYLLVTVLRPDGELAGDVDFGFTHRSGRGSSSRSGGSPPRTKEGIYVYSVPEGSRHAYYVEPTAKDMFLVEVEAEGFGELEVPLTPGQREVTIQLVGEATLDVRIVGYAGSGLENKLHVSLMVLHDGKPSSSHSFTGDSVSAQGVAHFKSLSAQHYRLSLSTEWRNDVENGYQASYGLTTMDTLLRTGPNQVDLSIPPLYSLEVFVEGTEDERQVVLERMISSDVDTDKTVRISSKGTDDRGRVMFDLLPAGDYRLRSTGVKGLTPVSVPSAPVTLTATE